MAFNINDFRTNLQGDGARPNLFEVQFNAWPGFVAGSTQPASFFCNATTLPGSDIGVAEVQYFGRQVKLAGNRTYADWTVQIINDEDFYLRNVMEQWVAGINSPISNLRTGGALTVDGGYGSDATVIQYGKQGDILKVYTFYGMWPTSISTIDLAWGTNDTVEEFSVTFAYQYFLTNDSTGGTLEPV